MSGRRLRWVTAVAGALLLAGCGTGGDSPDEAVPAVPRSTPFSVEVPVPGATLPPDPSAREVPSPADLTLALVVPQEPDPVTSTLVDAVEQWAADRGVDVAVHVLPPDGRLQPLVDDLATGDGTPIVVAPGEGLVDMLDEVSAQNLGVEFLVLGAQLPEPTANVTAVVWTGATSRGSRAPADEPPDSSSVSAERSTAAVGAGLASVLQGVTGVVVHLDA